MGAELRGAGPGRAPTLGVIAGPPPTRTATAESHARPRAGEARPGGRSATGRAQRDRAVPTAAGQAQRWPGVEGDQGSPLFLGLPKELAAGKARLGGHLTRRRRAAEARADECLDPPTCSCQIGSPFSRRTE